MVTVLRNRLHYLITLYIACKKPQKRNKKTVCEIANGLFRNRIETLKLLFYYFYFSNCTLLVGFYKVNTTRQ